MRVRPARGAGIDHSHWPSAAAIRNPLTLVRLCFATDNFSAFVLRDNERLIRDWAAGCLIPAGLCWCRGRVCHKEQAKQQAAGQRSDDRLKGHSRPKSFIPLNVGGGHWQRFPLTIPLSWMV